MKNTSKRVFFRTGLNFNFGIILKSVIMKNLKNLITFILFLGLFSQGFSQINKKTKVFAGVTMGDLEFSDDEASEEYNYKSDIGVTVGVVQPFAFNEKMALDVDFRVSYYRFNVVALSKIDYQLTYLELSPSFNYTAPFGLYGKFGPFISYGVYGEQNSDSGNYEVFEDGGFIRLNTGIDAQLGYTFSRFGAFLEYRKGLINLEDNDSSKGQKSMLNAFNIGLFFGF